MIDLNDTQLVFVPLAGKVKQRDSLTLIAKGTFQLTPDDMATLCEPDEQLPAAGDEYTDGDKNAALRYDADFAYFKPNADILLVGSCHTPDNKALSQCRVSLGVGKYVKSLLVLGNRQWVGAVSGGRTTEPEPFTQLAMDYQYTALYNKYAEQQTKWNLRKLITDKLPLPNVQPITFIDKFTASVSYEPHGFSPINRVWEQRANKMGRYNGDYLTDYWPWFPGDFDWRYFNSAPEDQQLDGYLNGDEKLYVENMHPQYAQYHSQLPGLRVRCFLNEAEHHLQNYREIPMNLDTLWVDMENEKLVLVWRGVANVNAEDYEEIQQVQLVTEKLSESPSPEAYYKDKLLEHISTEEAVDTTIVQPKSEDDDEKTLLKTRLQPPKMATGLLDLEGMDVEMQSQVNQTLDQARKAIADAGQDPAMVDQLMQAQDPNAVLAAMFAKLGIDLSQSDKVVQQSRENTAKLLQEHGIDTEEYLALFDEAELDDAAQPDETSPVFDKEAIQQQARQGVSFSGKDFSGQDLSQLDLPSADFKNATLTDANLQGSNLANADFSGATLSGASLDKTVLTGAILADADLQGATLAAAVLNEANLGSADFSDCDLSKALLIKVVANHARFCRATLHDSVISEAQLCSANFDSAKLDNANFHSAVLTGASFNYVSGNRVIMENADLTDLKASESCVLKQANLTQVKGGGAVFTGADLSGSNLSNSQFSQALFTDATLTNTDISCCDFTKTNFRKANLQKADARKSNFFQAILERADLTKTNFSGSNLYEVEFLGAVIGKTKFSKANLASTKLAKLHKIH